MAAKPVKRAESLRYLGLDESASLEDIKHEYKKQALMCHPDKNPDDEAATDKFQRLSEAYTNLTKAEEDEEEDDATLFDLLRMFAELIRQRQSHYNGYDHHPGFVFCGYDFSDDDEDDDSDEIFRTYYRQRQQQDKSPFLSKPRSSQERSKKSYRKQSKREYLATVDQNKAKTGTNRKQYYVSEKKAQTSNLHQTPKADKTASENNSRVNSSNSKKPSKKQQLAEQRRREKEMEEIAENLKAKKLADEEKERKRKEQEKLRLAEMEKSKAESDRNAARLLHNSSRKKTTDSPKTSTDSSTLSKQTDQKNSSQKSSRVSAESPANEGVCASFLTKAPAPPVGAVLSSHLGYPASPTNTSSSSTHPRAVGRGRGRGRARMNSNTNTNQTPGGLSTSELFSHDVSRGTGTDHKWWDSETKSADRSNVHEKYLQGPAKTSDGRQAYIRHFEQPAKQNQQLGLNTSSFTPADVNTGAANARQGFGIPAGFKPRSQAPNNSNRSEGPFDNAPSQHRHGRGRGFGSRSYRSAKDTGAGSRDVYNPPISQPAKPQMSTSNSWGTLDNKAESPHFSTKADDVFAEPPKPKTVNFWREREAFCSSARPGSEDEEQRMLEEALRISALEAQASQGDVAAVSEWNTDSSIQNLSTSETGQLRSAPPSFLTNGNNPNGASTSLFSEDNKVQPAPSSLLNAPNSHPSYTAPAQPSHNNGEEKKSDLPKFEDFKEEVKKMSGSKSKADGQGLRSQGMVLEGVLNRNDRFGSGPKAKPEPVLPQKHSTVKLSELNSNFGGDQEKLDFVFDLGTREKENSVSSAVLTASELFNTPKVSSGKLEDGWSLDSDTEADENAESADNRRKILSDVSDDNDDDNYSSNSVSSAQNSESNMGSIQNASVSSSGIAVSFPQVANAWPNAFTAYPYMPGAFPSMPGFIPAMPVTNPMTPVGATSLHHSPLPGFVPPYGLPAFYPASINHGVMGCAAPPGGETQLQGTNPPPGLS